jgi:hypothetical protein
LTACCDEGRHDCGFEGSCQVQPHLGVVNGAVRAALAGISLASLTVAPVKTGAAGGLTPTPQNETTTAALGVACLPTPFAGATS